MTALTKRVRALEAELGADWRHYHIAAQMSRFATGVLITVLWSLHSGLTDWTDLVPAVWTAMWVTAAQMWPQVPWSLIRDRPRSARVAVWRCRWLMRPPGCSAHVVGTGRPGR